MANTVKTVGVRLGPTAFGNHGVTASDLVTPTTFAVVEGQVEGTVLGAMVLPENTIVSIADGWDQNGALVLSETGEWSAGATPLLALVNPTPQSRILIYNYVTGLGVYQQITFNVSAAEEEGGDPDIDLDFTRQTEVGATFADLGVAVEDLDAGGLHVIGAGRTFTAKYSKHPSLVMDGTGGGVTSVTDLPFDTVRGCTPVSFYRDGFSEFGGEVSTVDAVAGVPFVQKVQFGPTDGVTTAPGYFIQITGCKTGDNVLCANASDMLGAPIAGGAVAAWATLISRDVANGSQVMWFLINPDTNGPVNLYVYPYGSGAMTVYDHQQALGIAVPSEDPETTTTPLVVGANAPTITGNLYDLLTAPTGAVRIEVRASTILPSKIIDMDGDSMLKMHSPGVVKAGTADDIFAVLPMSGWLGISLIYLQWSPGGTKLCGNEGVVIDGPAMSMDGVLKFMPDADAWLARVSGWTSLAASDEIIQSRVSLGNKRFEGTGTPGVRGSMQVYGITPVNQYKVFDHCPALMFRGLGGEDDPGGRETCADLYAPGQVGPLGEPANWAAREWFGSLAEGNQNVPINGSTAFHPDTERFLDHEDAGDYIGQIDVGVTVDGALPGRAMQMWLGLFDSLPSGAQDIITAAYAAEPGSPSPPAILGASICSMNAITLPVRSVFMGGRVKHPNADHAWTAFPWTSGYKPSINGFVEWDIHEYVQETAYAASVRWMRSGLHDHTTGGGGNVGSFDTGFDLTADFHTYEAVARDLPGETGHWIVFSFDGMVTGALQAVGTLSRSDIRMLIIGDVEGDGNWPGPVTAQTLLDLAGAGGRGKAMSISGYCQGMALQPAPTQLPFTLSATEGDEYAAFSSVIENALASSTVTLAHVSKAGGGDPGDWSKVGDAIQIAEPELGVYTLTIHGEDPTATNPLITTEIEVTINYAALGLTGTTSASVSVGDTVTFLPTTVGGTRPYTYEFTGPTEPTGFTFNPATGGFVWVVDADDTGTVTGLEITVTDADANTAVLTLDDVTVFDPATLWDHDDDAGLQDWYDVGDAATRIVVDGKLSTLESKGPGGHDYTQSDAAHRIPFTLSGAGGFPSADFTDGVIQSMTTGSYALAQAFTVIDVFVMGTGTSSYPTLFDGKYTSSGSRALMWQSRIDTSPANRPGMYAGTALTPVGAAALVDGSAYTQIGVFDGADSSIAINGGTAVTGDPGSAGIDGTQLGEDFDANHGTSRWRERIITTSTDLATLQKHEGRIAHKYGRQADLPSDHPYKTSPPLI